MPRHALVVMGVAGVGKSRIGEALASSLQLPFVEGDAFHPPESVAQMRAGIPLTDDSRQGWLQSLATQLRDARDRYQGVVLTCSALKRRYRDVLRSGDDSLQFILLHGDTALLRERLTTRAGHYMPASLLESQVSTLEIPSPDEHAWTYDVQLAPDDIVSAILARLHSRTESQPR